MSRTLYFFTEPSGGVALLQGRHKLIDEVLKKRQNDPKCQQLPRGSELPRSYELRVRYVLEDADVTIQTIEVSFAGETVASSSKYWSLLYSLEQANDPPPPNPISNTYFIDDDFALEPVRELLLRYEQNQQVRRLVRQGEDALWDEHDDTADRYRSEIDAAEYVGHTDEEDVDGGVSD